MVTTYFKNMLANHIWHTADAAALPENYYLALSATQPQEDGTGVTEPGAASGYARAAMTGLGVSADGVVKNASVISWPKVTTNEGGVGHWALFDAATGGHPLMGGSLEEVKHLDKGTTMTIDPETLVLKVLGA